MEVAHVKDSYETCYCIISYEIKQKSFSEKLPIKWSQSFFFLFKFFRMGGTADLKSGKEKRETFFFSIFFFNKRMERFKKRRTEDLIVAKVINTHSETVLHLNFIWWITSMW